MIQFGGSICSQGFSGIMAWQVGFLQGLGLNGGGRFVVQLQKQSSSTAFIRLRFVLSLPIDS